MFCDNKKKFAVYTSGNCTRIKKAIEIYPELLCRIKFIITDECENLVLKQYFNKLGIQYYNFDVKQIYNKEKRNFLLSNYIEEKLNQNNIDYCFTFGKHILKGRILEKYKYRLINFHPGIIPDVIGLNAIDTAIKEKKRYIGNTVHFIDEGVDSGPIIMQNQILAENFDKYGYDIFLDSMTELIWKTVRLLELDRIIIKNNKVIIKGADYTVSRVFPEFNV